MSSHLEETNEVVILRHDRVGALAIVAVCVVAVVGLWSIRDEADRAAVWVAIILFGGLGVFSGIMRLLP